MSDNGADEYSDYGEEEYYYVEEEYSVADDLAEHAVQSPPPTVYDEEAIENWDRFDYFNDLEYQSDGYEDVERPQNGKRRHSDVVAGSRKRQRVPKLLGHKSMAEESPVVWRSQKRQAPKSNPLDEKAKTYTLLADWRERMPDQLPWQRTNLAAGLSASTDESLSKPVLALQPNLEADENEYEDEELGNELEGPEIDQATLLKVLQERLAIAGGPLSNMDPQQLLRFAMRMAAGEGNEDDIAGELADEMLDQSAEGEDEEEEDATLLSWVAQQRNAGDVVVNNSLPAIKSSPKEEVARPLTPPSSDSNQRVVLGGDVSMVDTVEPELPKEVTGSLHPPSRKRRLENAAASPSKRRTTATASRVLD